MNLVNNAFVSQREGPWSESWSGRGPFCGVFAYFTHVCLGFFPWYSGLLSVSSNSPKHAFTVWLVTLQSMYCMIIDGWISAGLILVTYCSISEKTGCSFHDETNNSDIVCLPIISPTAKHQTALWTRCILDHGQILRVKVISGQCRCWF